jgi:hypothetical protein
MMTDSAIRRAVSRDGLATGATLIGGVGRLGLPFPGGLLAATRDRLAGRTTITRPARLECGMRISPSSSAHASPMAQTAYGVGLAAGVAGACSAAISNLCSSRCSNWRPFATTAAMRVVLVIDIRGSASSRTTSASLPTSTVRQQRFRPGSVSVCSCWAPWPPAPHPRALVGTMPAPQPAAG